jgi:hypothetical protein
MTASRLLRSAPKTRCLKKLAQRLGEHGPADHGGARVVGEPGQGARSSWHWAATVVGESLMDAAVVPVVAQVAYDVRTQRLAGRRRRVPTRFAARPKPKPVLPPAAQAGAATSRAAAANTRHARNDLRLRRQLQLLNCHLNGGNRNNPKP